MTVDADAGRSLGVDRTRDHRLVFRKRLLGDHRAREVQVAARPRLLGAEAAQVLDRPCRSDPGVSRSLNDGMIWENARAGPPLVMMARHWTSGFGRRGRAIAEIRKRRRPLEAGEVLRLSFPVGTVARDAPGVVDLLAGVELQPGEAEADRQALAPTAPSLSTPKIANPSRRRSTGARDRNAAARRVHEIGSEQPTCVQEEAVGRTGTGRTSRSMLWEARPAVTLLKSRFSLTP